MRIQEEGINLWTSTDETKAPGGPTKN